ncbi:MAG: DegT/DnrJ/EryC1/StrS family aminotransferase [Prevotella sp.]|nr:DegT/DnrJ/EryC1/StrS family aminotransferase [Prevotella sp.]
MDNKIITVTSPLLPNLDEFNEMLKEIWASKWITNMGQFHKLLEQALAEYLHVPYVCLFTNGTLPLMTALQALRITGEVITTPYSFVATTHSIWWNHCKPVFVDIDPRTGNIDPDKIEAAITPATTCIMPVHVYGKPCDTKRIKEIADKYGLKIIYDAAHAFGVEVPAEQYGLEAYDEKGLAGIMNAGDMSTLSFHATKVFNTVEGGALVVHDEKTKKRIDNLKNFGITDEVTVIAPGINGKMDEVRSAYGLLNLKQVDTAIKARKEVANKYRGVLRKVDGISFWEDIPGVRHNFSYFPIFIDANVFGMTRDELYFKMKEQGILSRRYFYPLISSFPTYRGLPSSNKENLPIANKMADEVLCLPMHHVLTDNDIKRILSFFIHE